MRADALNPAGSGASRSPAPGGDRWAVVLAAGEGSRLAGLARERDGRPVPKQFCSLNGGQTLLDDALARARSVAPVERIVVIVAADQERHWRPALAALPAGNIVVQPRNRGTAFGILLPLLAILERDAGAQVAFLPSDHFVADESALAAGLEAALDAVDRDPLGITFLGITPDEADTGLGYITPAETAVDGTTRIGHFVEKPSLRIAHRLIAAGALWNSFIFCGTASAIVRLVAARQGEAVQRMREALRQPPASRALERLYDELAAVDFSKDVVENAESSLRVRAVPACGWSDLGTPQRLGECLKRLPFAAAADVRGSFTHNVINLAEAYRAFVAAPPLGTAA